MQRKKGGLQIEAMQSELFYDMEAKSRADQDPIMQQKQQQQHIKSHFQASCFADDCDSVSKRKHLLDRETESDCIDVLLAAIIAW